MLYRPSDWPYKVVTKWSVWVSGCARSGVGAHSASADLIAVTLTGAFSAYYDLAGTQTAGHITDPGGVFWWGS